MSKQILDDIHGFIKFIEACGYTVSISFIENKFSIYTEDLMRYDFHPHSVCNYMKKNGKTENRCVCNKNNLRNSSLDKPYYDCCYAGVEEFLIPVRYDNLLICCIHISGYRGVLEKSKYKMEKISEQCTEQFFKLYNELSIEVPTMEKVLSFVKPLQYMLTDLYLECQKKQNKENNSTSLDDIYIKALNFIHDNYSGNLTCDTIAEHLKYSASYIRYVFKKSDKISVQAKINQIRLNKAKQLIHITNMSISEIAFSVGYNDSNYFSTAFKKHFGVSPKEYRSENLMK